MQFSSRLNLASHILLYLAAYQDKQKVTSEVLADTTGVNPVNIRKTLCLLKEAGLVQTKPGVGGTSLARDPKDITLADIFDAVEDKGTDLFPMHQNPNPNCPVGRTIKHVMDARIKVLETSMHQEMEHMTLEEMLEDMNREIQTQENASKK